MKAALEREWVRARTSPAVPPVLTGIRLEARSGRAGDCFEFGAPRRDPAALEDRARRELARLLPMLPASRRGQLAVEAGVVRWCLASPGGVVEETERPYLLETCAGIVLSLGDHESGGEPPWAGEVPLAGIDSGLPVVLGSSAVLALVAFFLEVAGNLGRKAAGPPSQSLSVLETGSSPYPPQHHPYTPRAEPAADRLLLDGGMWCAEEGTVDLSFLLFTRGERWLRPVAATNTFGRRNLVVQSTVPAARPPDALVVDSLIPRATPCPGTSVWEAELSLWRDGRVWSGPGPRRLELDAGRVLRCVAGTWEMPCPALDRDPIEGDACGLAPPLVTELTAADLKLPAERT